MAILPEACGPWGPPSPRQRVSGPTALWVSPRSPVPERRPGMGVRCGRGLPHAPSCWALWQPLLWGPVSAPGTGGARRSFPGCPQLPEAEAEGWPGPAAGQTPQLSCPGPGLGLGPGRNPEGPKLLPTCVPQVGVGWRGAEKLQNSLELRKTGPSCGAPLACLSAWVLGRGPGGGEEEAGRTHGAWCRPLLSRRGSKSNILQGRYFPCSAHAQFKRPLCSSKRASGLLFLMHTVKGKKITVIHIPRARGH